MDQQKMQRMLQMLLLLSGTKRHKLQDLAERFELSERTIYRYLDTFESVGFVLEREQGSYRLQKDSNIKSLQNLLHFSEEEVFILYETLNLIEDSSAIKEQLLRKLNVLYDYRILDQLKQHDDLNKIQIIREAIQNKKQVLLKDYRSSNSSSVSDRRVEAFDFLPDYRALWCFDAGSNMCKQFKLSRIATVEMTARYWENEKAHKIPFTDAFRMSDDAPIDHVVAVLSMKAYNLIIEEYPRSKPFIKEQGSGYLLNIPVASYLGIGRFVMGLPGEVEVLESEGFKEYLVGVREKFFGR